MQDTGWTPDALAAFWNVDRSYAWRLVDGEKPWSVERLLSLPDDLEARLEHLRAEDFGLVVIAPVSEAEALRCLAIGLLSMVRTSGLPARSGGQLKADLPLAVRKTGTR